MCFLLLLHVLLILLMRRIHLTLINNLFVKIMSSATWWLCHSRASSEHSSSLGRYRLTSLNRFVFIRTYGYVSESCLFTELAKAVRTLDVRICSGSFSQGRKDLLCLIYLWACIQFAYSGILQSTWGKTFLWWHHSWLGPVINCLLPKRWRRRHIIIICICVNGHIAHKLFLKQFKLGVISISFNFHIRYVQHRFESV